MIIINKVIISKTFLIIHVFIIIINNTFIILIITVFNVIIDGDIVSFMSITIIIITVKLINANYL